MFHKSWNSVAWSTSSIKHMQIVIYLHLRYFICSKWITEINQLETRKDCIITHKLISDRLFREFRVWVFQIFFSRNMRCYHCSAHESRPIKVMKKIVLKYTIYRIFPHFWSSERKKKRREEKCIREWKLLVSIASRREKEKIIS